MAFGTSLVVDFIGNTVDLMNSFEEVENGAGKMGAGMAKTGAKMTAGFTLPIVGAGTAAVMAANDVNQGLANVASLGVSDTAMGTMLDDLQDMAIRMDRDVEDLTDGAYNAFSAFGETADTMGILEVAAMGATGGLTSASDQIALLSVIMKNYNDVTEEGAQKASDLAFKTVELGQTTMPELAASMGRVIPLASDLGLAQEELFGVFATATGTTGTAAEVATALRGTVQAFMSPTKDMAALIEDLGYASGEAMIDALGYQESLNAVADAADKSGKPLQAYISGVEGVGLASALTGNLSEALTEKTQEMYGAAGTTLKAFEAQTTGINEYGSSLGNLKIRLNVFMQDLGQVLIPLLQQLVDKLWPVTERILAWADGLTKLSPKWQAIIVGIGVFAAALGPVLVGLGFMVSNFAALAPVVGAVGTAFGLLVSPLGLIVLGFGALVAVDFLGMRTAIQGLYETMQTWFSLITENWEQVRAFIDLFINNDMSQSGMMEVIGALPEQLQPLAERLMEVRNAFETWIGSIQDAGMGVWTTITTGVDAVKESFSGLAEAFEGLVAVFGGGGEEGTGGKIAAAIGAGAALTAIHSIEAAIEAFGVIVEGFVTALTGVIDLIASTVTGISEIINGILVGDSEAIVQGYTTILQGFVDYIVNWVAMITEMFTGLGGAIGGLAQDVAAGLGVEFATPAWVETLMTWVPLVPEWVEAWLAFIPEIPQWVADFLAWTPEVPAWVTSLFDFTLLKPAWVTSFMNWKLARPDWLTSLLNWRPSFGPFGGNNGQLGKFSYSGGLITVGEAGRELVALPRGSRIFNNRETEGILSGTGGGVVFNINNLVVRSDNDVQRLAKELDDLRRRRTTRT